MKNTFIHKCSLFCLALVLCLSACQRDIEGLEPATFPSIAEVFIDGFSPGLEYAAFGGSVVTGFNVDEDVTYTGTASMRFEVPDVGDPAGAYVGGAYFVEGGRDLSGFDVLTFWARATRNANLDVVGFGNDLGELKHVATINNVPVNTNWQKYYIPIPDPAVLTQEKGMFYYSEGPENGEGYTFWIDEVKFEKSGTVVQKESGIVDGLNDARSAETGDVINVPGLYSLFNLPTGRDLRVGLAPGYFEFSSSDASIATITENNAIAVIDSGSTTITATLAGEASKGSLTINSTGAPLLPLSAAPSPTRSADSVLSLYSNVYQDEQVDTWNTRWLYSTAEESFIQIAGDDVIRYKNLNFVGIEWPSATKDISSMTHFHMDVWTPDPTSAAAFRVLLIDFGADNSFDGGDDTQHEMTFNAPTLQTGEWFSIDVPLSSFSGLTGRRNLAQLVLSGDLPNVLIDNVYFYRTGSTSGNDSPEMAAPSPTRDPGSVISIFSDAYSNVPGTNFNPDWGQATQVSELSVAGNNTLLYAGLNYQGTELASPIDVSAMTHFHIDVWTANSSALNTFLISNDPTMEKGVAVNVPTAGWLQLDIPLSDFTPVELNKIFQLKFDGAGDIYLDNIYFYNEGSGGDEPTIGAPDPTRDEGSVISIFSDSYTDVAGTNFNPDWGQATQTSIIDVAGNNTLLYAGLNYQGTELASQIDVTSMTHLHFDVWSRNSDNLMAFLISADPTTETFQSINMPTTGWLQVDIALTEFSPVELNKIFQFKFEGNGDVYLDNIYFYAEGVGGDEPTTGAPAPTRDAAKVISIFSDAYDDVAGTNFNPDWGQSTQTSIIDVVGNSTLLYDGLNYQGTELAGQIDVTSMTHLHIDVWTNNSNLLEAFIISENPTTEIGIPLNVPTTGWLQVDIPLSDFTPVELNKIFQFKFEGNGDIYLDNLYFYQE